MRRFNEKYCNPDEVGLYVHVPFCEAKCRFCHFYMVPRRHPLTSRLVTALITELDQACKNHRIATVYLGGGSPSHLPRSDLLRLVESIRSQLSGLVEFSVEVNPDQVDRELLAHLFGLGVNRLSIGAQSFHDRELAWLTRTYLSQQIGRVVGSAKDVGFTNMSLDLIYALPGSSLRCWRENLQAAIDLDVPHISAYSLTYEPGTQLDKQLQRGQVRPVGEEVDRAMYDLTIELLGQVGIEQYEISNLARAGFACQHNERYWKNLETVGIGPSASSFLAGWRSTNMLGIRPYIEAVEKGESVVAHRERLNDRDRACETAVLMLRRTQGFGLGEFKSHCGFDPLELFARPIAHYQGLGLVAMDGARVWLTRAGLPVADSILCDFIDPETGQ